MISNEIVNSPHIVRDITLSVIIEDMAWHSGLKDYLGDYLDGALVWFPCFLLKPSVVVSKKTNSESQ